MTKKMLGLNIETLLTKRGYEVLCAPDLTKARNIIQKESADIILLDVQLPDGYGPDLLEETVPFACTTTCNIDDSLR